MGDSELARATLRALGDDLRQGWDDQTVYRSVTSGGARDHLPLAALPHPLLEKVGQQFRWPLGADHKYERIAEAAAYLHLWKVEFGQWRAAVWEDPTDGVAWVVAAGLAKGEHSDRDDFYATLGRGLATRGKDWFLPTSDDRSLLRVERAAGLMGDWELDVQGHVIPAIADVIEGKTATIVVSHPVKAVEILTCTIELVVDSDESMLLVTRTHIDHEHSGFALRAEMLILTALEPSEQSWDTDGAREQGYWISTDAGAVADRQRALEGLVNERSLEQSSPGKVAHHAHAHHLMEHTVTGTAARALCGIYFVPRQDHLALDQCENCNSELGRLTKTSQPSCSTE